MGATNTDKHALACTPQLQLEAGAPIAHDQSTKMVFEVLFPLLVAIVLGAVTILIAFCTCKDCKPRRIHVRSGKVHHQEPQLQTRKRSTGKVG